MQHEKGACVRFGKGMQLAKDRIFDYTAYVSTSQRARVLTPFYLTAVYDDDLYCVQDIYTVQQPVNNLCYVKIDANHSRNQQQLRMPGKLT